MSILIKGINMPENCNECRFAVDGWCYASGQTNWYALTDYKVADECPLVEVPTPHGRLIEYEALKKALAKDWNVMDDQDFNNKAVWHRLEDASTVIEAEVEP